MLGRKQVSLLLLRGEEVCLLMVLLMNKLGWLLLQQHGVGGQLAT
jgi:hypothetical protein